MKFNDYLKASIKNGVLIFENDSDAMKYTRDFFPNNEGDTWVFQRGLIMDVLIASPFARDDTLITVPGIIMQSESAPETLAPPISQIAIWNSNSTGGYTVLGEQLANRVYRQPSCKTIQFINKMIKENDYTLGDNNEPILPYVINNLNYKKSLLDIKQCNFDEDVVVLFMTESGRIMRKSKML